MARRNIARTPDSGYKFKCQCCDEDVYQSAPPELLFALTVEGSGKRQHITSQSMQCCSECAFEIKEENQKIQRRLHLNTKQVIPLRPTHELPPEVQEAAAEIESRKVQSAASDAKLDKVIDMLGKLIELQAMQLSGGAFPPVVASSGIKLEAGSINEIPQPKRKILTPPKARKNATSKTAKPKPANKTAPKRKSR
jgi:hypothetical protein